MKSIVLSKSKILLTHAAFLQISSYIARPAAIYKAIELEINPAYIGAMAISFSILPLLLSVFVGRASDNGHNSKVLICGSILMIIVGIGFLSFSDSIIWLQVWIIALGLGHVMLVVGQQSQITELGKSDLDHAFGLYTFAGSIGQSIGPALLLLAGGSNLIPDTQMLFQIYLMSTVVLFILTLPLSRDFATNQTVSQSVSQQNLIQSIKNVGSDSKPILAIAMLVSLIVIGTVDVITIYLPVLGVERGISASIIGALLSLRALSTMASRFYLGKLSSNYGRNRLIIVSTALAGVFLASIAIDSPIIILGILVVLFGFTIGIGQPLTMTMIILSVPPATRNTWLALRLSANRIGQAAIPTSVGLTVLALGTSGVFGVSGLLLLGIAALTSKLLPKNYSSSLD
jgi:MFS family permease